MRLVLVGTYYSPYLGGIEIHMEQLAIALKEIGVDVKVLCLAGRHSAQDDTMRDGVLVRPLPSVGVGGSLRWARRISELSAADIVHFHGFSRPLLLRVLKDLDSAPLVVTPHGGVHAADKDPDPLRKAAKSVSDRIVAHRWLSHAAAVVCTTKVERAYLQDVLHLDPKRMFVLPYAIDSARFRPRPPGNRSSARLLVLARLARRKRIGDLLTALKTYPDLPGCDIAGQADDDARRLQKIAASLPPGRVRFLGPVYGTDKIELLRRAKALVLCSTWEAQSIAASEAMAMGVPVVASTEAAEGFPDGSILTFPLGNLEELADRIRGLDDDNALTALYRKMQQVRRGFPTPPQYARRALAIYQSAIAAS
jgi:glycosyltransferase involved in cell wall biosynthesis